MAQTRVSVELQSDLAELARLAGVVADFANTAELPSEFAGTLNLCLEEVVTNVIVHGYKEQRGTVRISLTAQPGEAMAEVEDDGPAFDPLARPAPNLDLPIDERPIGGLGIHLVRNLMDNVTYRRDNGHNRLTLTKRWGQPGT
jgi:anti-sigma regulatory factor (Ser/Thr protein kinase)